MRVVVSAGIDEFRQDEWNRLAGSRYPFLRHEFLAAAERSGSVGGQSGWVPSHIGLVDSNGQLAAALPLYEKSHSWGEFVFDWSWAHAYERAGLNYYPKLVATVPYTPATSCKLLARDASLRPKLIQAAIDLARERSCSSLHILFPEKQELGTIEDAGLMVRKDCQFHWRNRGYRCFDDFLATFSSAKRKKVRRDRRRVVEQGIGFRRFRGGDIGKDLLSTVYEFISITFLRRGSMPYFTIDFFSELCETLADHLLFIVAEIDGNPVAAAVFFDTDATLYGRYWGAAGQFDALHFETCYYQGIDFCIEHGRQTFEPGTQGEHKIARGFLPADTWSAHWLAHPQFYSAIGKYLAEERRHVDRYIDAVHTHSPYRDESSG